MQENKQLGPRIDPNSYHLPQIIKFQDNPLSQYYQPASRTTRSQISKGSYQTQNQLSIPYEFGHARRTSYQQKNNDNPILKQELYLSSESPNMHRRRKNTDQGIFEKEVRTPKSSGSGFNMNKFLSDYKEKVVNSNSRKSSWNDTSYFGDRQYDINQLKLVKRVESQEEKTIPQLPKISKITVDFINNWGDANLIGMKAIQFFTDDGVQIRPTTITPQTQSIFNLINQNVFTMCDQQTWTVPLGQPFSINFVFPRRFSLSMIRIWNYNKPNYTSRGVRSVRILGDSQTIFSGEIKKANGKLKTYAQTAEYILFTNSPTMFQFISTSDWLSNYEFDYLLELQSRLNEPEFSIIYPFKNLYNCHSVVRVEILQNYGDPGYTSYQKLRFYNISGNLIKYKNKTNKDKVMINPPSPIQFHIIQPSIIQKVVIKSSLSEASVRKLRIILDTGIQYIIVCGYNTDDQVFLLNSSPKYDFRGLNLKDSKLQNTLRLGKEIKIILHKNYGGKSIGFNKIQIFDVYNTPMLSSRQIPFYVSENMRYLESTPYSNWRTKCQSDSFLVNFQEAQPSQIVIKFQSVIVFGGVIVWNYGGSQQNSIKEMQIRIDDKVAYHGYLDKFQGIRSPHIILLSCKDQVYNNFKDYIKDRKGRQTVIYSNEGSLYFTQK